MKLGTGSHQYEWVENWAKIPADMQIGYTHGVVEDAQAVSHFRAGAANTDIEAQLAQAVRCMRTR